MSDTISCFPKSVSRAQAPVSSSLWAVNGERETHALRSPHESSLSQVSLRSHCWSFRLSNATFKILEKEKRNGFFGYFPLGYLTKK